MKGGIDICEWVPHEGTCKCECGCGVRFDCDRSDYVCPSCAKVHRARPGQGFVQCLDGTRRGRVRWGCVKFFCGWVTNGSTRPGLGVDRLWGVWVGGGEYGVRGDGLLEFQVLLLFFLSSFT